MCSIKDEPDSGSEAVSEPCVAALDGGTEEGNITVEEDDIKVEQSVDIKFEDSVDIKEENPEAIKYPPIKTEPEVSVWGVCVGQQQFVFPKSFAATKDNF
jgi:hypothetical protein